MVVRRWRRYVTKKKMGGVLGDVREPALRHVVEEAVEAHALEEGRVSCETTSLLIHENGTAPQP